MWGVRSGAVLVWTLASFTYAQFLNTTSTPLATNTGGVPIVTPTPTPSSQSSLSPCAIISSSASDYYSSAHPGATTYPSVSVSLALECLESVPLDTNRSIAFLEYIYPFLQFQSNQAYLKDLPSGWTLDGVDLFGGLSQIYQNLVSGAYSNQWQFETDLYTLVNILPRDYHLNLPLPLISVFSFGTYYSLVSISSDGISLPEVYFGAEMINYLEDINATNLPSPIVSINDEPAADYILRKGLETQQYLDPDAIYNLMFYSLPLSQQENGNAYSYGGHAFGFQSENTTYTFANGTTISPVNVAKVIVPFNRVTDGTTLFNIHEVPLSTTSGSGSLEPGTGDPSEAGGTTTTTTTTPTPTPMPTTQTTSSTISSVHGYPTPVILHKSGYTGGYFLKDLNVAVLALTAFADPAESEEGNVIQQTVIKHFLAACKAAGMSKLIVDLQGNGGGHIESGYDAFKQLFPTIEPFGATRFRYTPLVEYISMLASESGVYSPSAWSEYQVQAVVDVNLDDFASYKDFVGPDMIYGDNFTSLMRFNLSDPTIQLPFVISGYLNNTNISPQLFAAEDIVVLYDGACGSTCAIFSQLMKGQAGVRSISVGGRPQHGPMQGVAGSKGAEVWTYNELTTTLTELTSIYEFEKMPIPPYTGPSEYTIPQSAPPLGLSLDSRGRFNLRNNYRSAAPSEIPLHFIYEAANCRLFYTASDIIAIEKLWERVVDVAWGEGKCVKGSTVRSDDRMPGAAYETVPFGEGARSKISLDSALPGFVENTHTGKSEGIGSFILQLIS